MPELPEVETVRRGLQPAMEGARIVAVQLNRANLRFPFPERFADRLTGARVITLNRRAKFLLAGLSTGETLILHLGMSGRFIVERDDEANRPGVFHHEAGRLPAHDHVVLTCDNGARITYNDPRRFGFMLLADSATLDQHPQIAGIGIEPLGNAFSGDSLDALFAGRRTPLKAALLDQRLIAGLGNIYVCEALSRAGLSPVRAAGTLCGPGKTPRRMREMLATAIRDVLTEAVAAGGSSISDHARTDGSLGYFQHRFRVYDREGASCPTPGCTGVVLRMVQSGRSTFHCATCQR